MHLWKRNRYLLPVRLAEEPDLDCDLEVLAGDLGPDVQGSDMGQQDVDRADVNSVLDATLELRAFDLERLDRGLEVYKRLNRNRLVVQVQCTDDLRRDGSISNRSVRRSCQERTRMPRVKPRYPMMSNFLSMLTAYPASSAFFCAILARLSTSSSSSKASAKSGLASSQIAAVILVNEGHPQQSDDLLSS